MKNPLKNTEPVKMSKGWKGGGKKYKYGTAWMNPAKGKKIILYNKGWFRGLEDMYVVSLMEMGMKRKDTPFKKKSQAMKYVKKLMK